ncbi:hypothetical protein FDECE_3828 [Fusarium decemcellulare]|nr:hypothetical protein FDECE_3828 [Fusarium decemcellulare]
MSVSRPAPNAGSRRFTPIVLLIYDLLVIRFSNPLVWRCPTQKYLRPLFTDNFSKKHLDIGVGNGYFPTKALADLGRREGRKPKDQQLTLADLSEHSLESAKHRVISQHPEANVQCVLADAAKQLPAELRNDKFDSASLYLVLHCMPGPTASKAEAIRNAKSVLTGNGVLVGSTALGKKWEKTQEGYRVMHDQKLGRLTTFALGFYNKRGIFDNYQEDPNVFDKTLREEFEDVETRVIGMMFLFRASKPRKV